MIVLLSAGFYMASACFATDLYNLDCQVKFNEILRNKLGLAASINRVDVVGQPALSAAAPALSAKRVKHIVWDDVSQYLLTQTPEGRELLEKTTHVVGLNDPRMRSNVYYAYTQFIKAAKSRYDAAEIQELAGRLEKAVDEIKKYKNHVNGRLDFRARAVLDKYAAFQLNIAVEDGIRFVRPGGYDFGLAWFSASQEKRLLRAPWIAENRVNVFFLRPDPGTKIAASDLKMLKGLLTQYLMKETVAGRSILAQVTGMAGIKDLPLSAAELEAGFMELISKLKNTAPSLGWTGNPLGYKPIREFFEKLKWADDPKRSAVDLEKAFLALVRRLKPFKPENPDISAFHALLQRKKGMDLEAAFGVFIERMKYSKGSPGAGDLIARIRMADDVLPPVRTRASHWRSPATYSHEDLVRLQLYAEEQLRLEKSNKLLLAKSNPAAKNILLADLNDPFFVPASLRLGGKALADYQARSFMSRMALCLKNMPKAERSRKALHLAFAEVGWNELLTAGTYISAAGSKPVDWRNLPTDLVIGLTGFADPFIPSLGSTMIGKYFYMVALFEGQEALDGAIYYFAPWTETYGHDKFEVTKARLTVSAAFVTVSPVVKLPLLTFLLGMKCLYPNATMTVTAAGMQLAYKVGAGHMFFRLRNMHYDKKGIPRSPE